MTVIVSSFLPFPNILWWSYMSGASKLVLDAAEHFEKMTYRNKYFITGANGQIQLSIPLKNGRNQRNAMQAVQIDNTQAWQQQHWRTIMSVYNRSPFFEYYRPELEAFYLKEYDRLLDFNQASISWLKKQLQCTYEEEVASAYHADYEQAIDLRKGLKPGLEKKAVDEKEGYYQLFSDRNGFFRNLSMLDLLFSEGPNAMAWIRQHKEQIQAWV